jgi:hypothetical protein
MAALLVLFTFGCGGTQGESPRGPCEPVEAAPLTDVDAETLAGTYRLTLVATQGRMAGNETEVRLELRPQEPGLRPVPGVDGEPLPGTVQALIGTLSEGLEDVGAWVPGEVGSEDPEAPGVSVLLTEGEPMDGPTSRLLLRVGSEANVRGRISFDDAYTVLRVARVTDEGLFGRWESGLRTEQAGGHFCAVR